MTRGPDPRRLAAPAAAAGAALLVSGLVLAAAGADPLAALGALVEGAFGDRFALVDTLVKSCPLALMGLAVAIAFRSGVWNIGADGQLLVGALAATAAAQAAGDRTLALPAALACGIVAGALWAGLAAALKLRRQVNEVISTIMLNFVAARLVGFAVHGPLMEAAGRYPQSDPLPAAAELPALGSGLHGGVLLALAAAPLVWFLLHRTTLGFRWRAAGENFLAARLAGLAPGRATMSAMLVSGGLAGLAGGIEVAGVTHRLFEQFSGGQGYTAIAVALLARLHPGGVIVSALFFAALAAGSGAMQRSAGVSAVFASIVQATVILALLAAEAPRFTRRRGGGGAAPHAEAV
ncbi:MAG: ABC transporter permease [Deltaproteobacteria bacterium]|nr:ABC transporter permease [Deltaproteobacteria bacterium]